MSLTIRYPKFAAKYACAVSLLICFAQYTWADPTPIPCTTPIPQPTPPVPVDLNIVAHQDDDILFMNPDILNSVAEGHRQVTVYITAGTVGLRADIGTRDYGLEREEGAIAGYSKLLQLADAIKACPNHFDNFTAQSFDRDSRYPAGCDSTCIACEEHSCELSTAGDARGQRGQMKIGSRTLNVATIGDGPSGPRVLLIFLRVDSPCTVANTADPDNGCAQPPVTLAQLFTSPDKKLQIQSRFSQAGYTKQQLITQLVQILQLVQADKVRTQDPADGIIVDDPGANQLDDHGCHPDRPTNYYDHTDHVWGARFAREALSHYDHMTGVKLPADYSIYMGYNLEWNEESTNPPRVSTEEFCLKKSIFFRYALHDIGAVVSTTPQGDGFNCYSYDYVGYQQSLQPGLP